MNFQAPDRGRAEAAVPRVVDGEAPLGPSGFLLATVVVLIAGKPWGLISPEALGVAVASSRSAPGWRIPAAIRPALVLIARDPDRVGRVDIDCFRLRGRNGTIWRHDTARAFIARMGFAFDISSDRAHLAVAPVGFSMGEAA